MPFGNVREFLKPATKGLRTDLPVNLVPDDFLIGGKNVVLRDGSIITRPGLAPIVTAAPSASRVMGGIFYKDHTDVERLVVGTKLGFFQYTGGASWADITGSALTGNDTAQVRFATFKISNSTRLIAVNDTDPVQVYTGTGTFAALGGSPPVAKCVTTAFQRVILANVIVAGGRRSSSLWISGFQDTTDWTALREVSLPDTGDSIVEVRALNDQVFVIYKDRSQWVATGAGGIFPFIFELKDRQPGPCSPGAVVQAEDKHYYIGQDGNVYRFDGSRSTPIGGFVKRAIQEDVDWTLQGRVHGFYDLKNREIWWFWPKAGSSTQTGGIVYRVPYEDVPAAFSPLTLYSFLITASGEWNELSNSTWNDLTGTWDALQLTFPTWQNFNGQARPGGFAGASTGQVHRFGEAGTDNGTMFDADWQSPFRSYAGLGNSVRVDAIESLFKTVASVTPVSIVLLKTDTLRDDGTTSVGIVDAGDNQLLRVDFRDELARFISVQHRITGTFGGIRYLGSNLYLYTRGAD